MAKGDHICVKRWGGVYSHHGIDMGDGTVVHFSGEPLRMRHACVRCDDLEDFLAEGELYVVEYADAPREPDEVAEAARSHVGEVGYDMWRNNCEHFATYCKTGQHQSKQVVRMAKVAFGVAVTGAVVATSVGLYAFGGRGKRRWT